MKIREVEITCVKGIRQSLPFHVKDKSIVLVGDNGTGKSSFELALRWALTGKSAPETPPSLDSEACSRTHMMAGDTQPSVKILFSDESTINVTPGAVDVDGNGAEYREHCTRANPFLRRAELQHLILDKPRDRFKYLESFLDLDEADGIRDELNSAAVVHKTLADAEYAKSSSAVETVRGKLPEVWRLPAATWDNGVASILRAASELGQIDLPDQGWDELVDALPRIKALSSDDGLVKERIRLVAARGGAQALIDQTGDELPDPLEPLNDDLRDLSEKTTDSDLSELLSHAQQHLSISETESCPVCKQDIDRLQTIQSLDERIDALKQYNDSVKRLNEASANWAKWLRLVRTNLDSLLPVLDSYRDRISDNEVQNAVDLLQTLTDDVADDPGRGIAWVLVSQSVQVGKAALVMGAWLLSEIDSELGKLPPEGATAQLIQLTSVIDEVEDQKDKYHTAEEIGARERSKQVVLENLADSVRLARQDIAHNLFEEIGALVSNYYTQIHPNDREDEVTAPPAIVVQRHSGGTASIRGRFGGEEAKNPQWIYSDGHMDTVALCIFLALRRFRASQESDPKLMVLDDVVLSIDLNHARRLIELIRDDFGDHQVFILTHNRLFAHWCTSLIPGIRTIPILGWSLEHGPRLGEHECAVERVRGSFENGTPKSISLELMAMMDEFLADVRFQYSLSVRAKRGEQYTLTEIWEPFVKSCKGLQKKIGEPLNVLLESLEVLRDLPAIRNSLPAHENEFARQYPLGTIREIAETACCLVEQLYCTNCSSFSAPIPNRDNPSVMHCRCRQVRYVPDSLMDSIGDEGEESGS